jgi:hypothetical protein
MKGAGGSRTNKKKAKSKTQVRRGTWSEQRMGRTGEVLVKLLVESHSESWTDCSVGRQQGKMG